MIFTGIINGMFNIINGIINLIPGEPTTINFMTESFKTYADTIFNNLGLIDIIMPLNAAKTMLNGIIIMLIAKFTYSLFMFVIHKVPFVGIR